MGFEGKIRSAAGIALWTGLLLTALALTARAAAAPAPEQLLRFGEVGTGAGQTSGPRGIATDSSSGHVYVVETSNRRVSEFTSWGVFVKAWGWGVANGSGVLQTCTVTCSTSPSGTGVGQFNSPQGATVDSNGDVYVVDKSNRRVQKFNANGEFLLMFGGGVNQGPNNPGNRCTKEHVGLGDTCGIGSSGTGPGQFGAWKTASFIAIGPGDVVYVGDNNRIQKFSPAGVFEGQIALPGYGFINGLAIDLSGNLYVIAENLPGVRKLNPSGTEQLGVLDVGSPTAIAIDPVGSAYVFDGADLEIHKFGPGGKALASFGKAQGFSASTGMATNVLGDGLTGPGPLYVVNSTPASSFIQAYSPEPLFEPPPLTAPTVGDQYATSVGTTSATVKATIKPNFWTTAYQVEYGLDDCEGTCPTLLSSSSALPTKYGTGTATVTLTGLLPGRTYRFHFVAASSGGGPTAGADQTLATRRAGGFALPAGRAYEMVSPPAKNGAEVASPTAAGGNLPSNAAPQQAAPDGESVTYRSFTAFGENLEGATTATQYRSERGPGGWSTESISPRAEDSSLNTPVVGISRDLNTSAIISLESSLAPQPLDPKAPVGYWNLYRRDNLTRSLRVATEVPPDEVPGVDYCVGYAGASADFKRMIFVARGGLDPSVPSVAGYSLYEWSEEGLELVSVLPGEITATPAEGTSFGGGGVIDNSNPSCGVANANFHRAISSDGSRVFWTDASLGVPRLFARIDGTETIQLDVPEGVPAVAAGGEFRGASEDGSKVFFTNPQALTTGASSGGDLYSYDFDLPQGGRLADLAPGGQVLGVLGVSEAGDYVYFVGKGVLDAGATAGAANLYAWHAGGTPRFVATLSNGAPDSASWSTAPGQQTARVTPDGGHVAFISNEMLTGFDNTVEGSPGCVVQANDELAGDADCAEVFLYDYEADDLTCASCNSSGARPTGPGLLPTWSTPYEQPRYLLDGGRLFFESYDPLALHDTNGKSDVYEFHSVGAGGCSTESSTFSEQTGGCVSPVSSGDSGDHSYFVDASSDGRDVFFSTRQGLVPWDEDGRFDVYDARIGGGFPPPAVPSSCAGEGCRPSVSPPGVDVPGSDRIVGSGSRGKGSCAGIRRQAQRLDAKARRLERRARGAADGRATRIQGQADRLGERAAALRREAGRCERNSRRAGR
jgi:hypothetical protein